jgi:hypothetical protein
MLRQKSMLRIDKAISFALRKSVRYPMTNIIPYLIWDLSANFEALQAVTKE